MPFLSLGITARGLTGDDLMKVHPENTLDMFKYGDVIETSAQGINVAKGAKLLVLNRDQVNQTDFPLLVETEDGRQLWVTIYNVKPTGENLADQMPPEPMDLYPHPEPQPTEEESDVTVSE